MEGGKQLLHVTSVALSKKHVAGIVSDRRKANQKNWKFLTCYYIGEITFCGTL